MQDRGKIIFLTHRTDHNEWIYRSERIQVSQNECLLDEYMTKTKAHGFDTEFNSSRHFESTLLLLQVGDSTVQYVADYTCPIMAPKVTAVLNKHTDNLLIGHNIKSDINQCHANGILIWNVYDTMVAEQRIYCGRTDIKYNLVDTGERRLKKMLDLDKETRKDFIRMTKKSVFFPRHITYAADDIPDLIPIAQAQRVILREYGQYDWFHAVENKLTPVLSAMEMRGMTLYEDKWIEVIEDRKKFRFEKQKELDAEITKYTGVKFKPRKAGTTTLLNLFGDHVEVMNTNTKHINYNSTPALKKWVVAMGEEVPIKIKKGEKKESLDEPAIQQFLIEHPNTKLRNFYDILLKYKEYQKFISSYGLKFLNYEIRKKGKGKIELGYKSRVTHNVHSSFGQCWTDTGRLSSGNAKEGFFNSQNIPKEKKIREAFGLHPDEIAAGYYFTTCDLSGAELIIMAALANDQHLYEIGADKIIDGKLVEGDLHSPFATKSWRAVYTFRKNKFITQYGLPTWETADKAKLDKYFTIFDTTNKAYVLTEDFTISKKSNKPLRDDFKRMGFGVVYGLKANKGAQTLNIAKDEAQIVIDTVSKEIPKTINMVQDAARCALADGFVIFNSISNNRRWFTEVIQLREALRINDRVKLYNACQRELTFKIRSEIEGAARNCRIQGTQADMIKESMVLVERDVAKYPRDRITIIRQGVPPIIQGNGIRLSVHDELGVVHKGKEYGARIAEIMTTTANKYLAPYSDNIKMRCSYETLTHWTK